MLQRIFSPRQSLVQRLGIFFTGVTMIFSMFFIQTTSAQAKQPQINSLGQGKLLIIGDSLTVGTDAFGLLRKKVRAKYIWTDVILDAKVGRRIEPFLPQVRKQLLAARTISAVVIALGTNDMISHRETFYPQRVIDQMMSTVGTTPVLWVNVQFSGLGRADWRARGSRFNRALRTAQSKYPNLYIADWSTSFSPTGKSRYIEDGVHLSVSGYKTRAVWMQSQILAFGTNIINASTTTSSTSSTTTTTTTTTLATSTTSSTTSSTMLSSTTSVGS